MSNYALSNHLYDYAVVTFTSGGDVTDADLNAVQEAENLRPLTEEELVTYKNRVLGGRPPERKTVAYGLTISVPPGILIRVKGTPYLDTDGSEKILRALEQGSWEGEWAFVFWQKRV